MRGCSLQCQLLNLPACRVGRELWTTDSARHSASSGSGWKRWPPDAVGSWEYIEVAFVAGWWTDWVVQLRRCVGINLSSLIVAEGHSRWREGRMNVRQYCGPRHRSSRHGKIVRRPGFILGRSGFRIIDPEILTGFCGFKHSYPENSDNWQIRPRSLPSTPFLIRFLQVTKSFYTVLPRLLKILK